jgi:hypothetical protein
MFDNCTHWCSHITVLGEMFFHHHPVRSIVHMTNGIEVGKPQWPRAL